MVLPMFKVGLLDLTELEVLDSEEEAFMDMVESIMNLIHTVQLGTDGMEVGQEVIEVRHTVLGL